MLHIIQDYMRKSIITNKHNEAGDYEVEVLIAYIQKALL